MRSKIKNRNIFRVIKVYVFLTTDFTNKLADSCVNYKLQNSVESHNLLNNILNEFCDK